MKQTTERTKTMKKLLFAMLAFALVSLSAGCESASEKVRRQREEKAETEKERLERLMAEAEKSPEVETDLSLGFKFGMTKKQVDSVLTDLESKGLEISRGSTCSMCIMKIDGEDIKVLIFTDYYDGLLYRLRYKIYERGINSLHNLFLSSKTYKENKFEEVTQDDSEMKTKLYIKENMMISFSIIIKGYWANKGSIMSYTNIPVARRVKREKEEKERKQKEQDKAKEEKLKSMF